jgi:tRNA pseudouridine-54 N-methylase
VGLLYQDPSMSHEEATRFLASNVEVNVTVALVSIGLNEQDRTWAQNTCLKYLASETESIAASAITALGHIARRHGDLDTKMVLPALESVKCKFPSLEGVVTDTLDDIDAFT